MYMKSSAERKIEQEIAVQLEDAARQIGQIAELR
jgi:hypothetical protein